MDSGVKGIVMEGAIAGGLMLSSDFSIGYGTDWDVAASLGPFPMIFLSFLRVLVASLLRSFEGPFAFGFWFPWAYCPGTLLARSLT